MKSKRLSKRTALASAVVVALAVPATFVCAAGGVSAANKTSIGQTMTLRDEGMFFVNGQLVLSNFPTAIGNPPTPMTFDVNQMFVHYRLSASNKHKVPIIMVHGGGLTGMSWETTPDGREGWGTYFTRQGFDTYVVDFPGRGRAGFNVTPLNQAKNQNDVSIQPSIGRTGNETAWTGIPLWANKSTPFRGCRLQRSIPTAPSIKLRLNSSALKAFPVLKSP